MEQWERKIRKKSTGKRAHMRLKEKKGREVPLCVLGVEHRLESLVRAAVSQVHETVTLVPTTRFDPPVHPHALPFERGERSLLLLFLLLGW